MLKINPVITTTNNLKNSGVQSRTAGLFVSTPIYKNDLRADIFEKSLPTQENKPSLLEKLSNIAFTGNKKNKYEQAKEISTQIHDTLKHNVGGVSTEKFEEAYKKITTKNVIPTIKAYDKISPQESLIGAICKESADSEKTRKDAVKGITDKLVDLGKNAGVQTDHYQKYFDKELDYQFDKFLLPVKAEQLDKITGALVQAIENKSSITTDERAMLKDAKLKDTQSYTTQILNTSVDRAKQSMQKQADYDGWSCKLGESIRKIWNSENQKELVHEDINNFKAQVDDLNKLVGTKEYNSKFKEVFEVEYDPELIAKYKEKEEKYTLAAVTTGVETNFKNSVKDLLSNKPFADKYMMPTVAVTGTMPVLVETKQEIYDRNLNAFAEFVGKGNVEDGKKQVEKQMKDYKIKPDSTLEDKYAVLQKMANKYEKRLHQNTMNATGKKDLSEMKKEYDDSYYAAFGVKNDIAKRVADYRASQMWSELIVQDTILCAASIPFWMCTAGTGFIPTLKIAAMHSAADLAVYGSDRLSSKQGMKKEDMKEMLKWTAVDGATAFVNQLSYKGIEALTSPIAKMSGKAAQVADFALCTAADVATDCGFEYLASGKVTLQGATYSVLFSAGGYIIDLKAADKFNRKTL